MLLAFELEVEEMRSDRLRQHFWLGLLILRDVA